MFPGDTSIADLQSQITPLLERAQTEIQAEGFEDEHIRLEPSLDMRYAGQSYEFTVPFTERFLANFHEGHRQAYGYARPESAITIVNLRVRATGLVSSPPVTAAPLGGPDPSEALIEQRPVTLVANQRDEIPFYRGEALKPGNQIAGPAIVIREDTTVFIGRGDQAQIDSFTNIWIETDRS
jgi:N-methylhydantoinase A